MNKTEGVEIIEQTPLAPELPPTMEQAKESGLNQEEIQIATKHGIVIEASEEKKEDGVKTEEKKGEENGKTEETQKAETVQDAIEKELEPEKEHDVLSKFNINERALYWKLKKEKIKRQNYEAERDQALVKLKARDEELKKLTDKVSELQNNIHQKKTEDPLADGEETTDEDEKPLTMRDLEEREKKKHEEREKQNKVKLERAEKLASVHLELEIDAKSRYTDFDKASEYTSEIIRAVNEGGLDKIFPDPRVRSRIIRQSNQLLAALSRADEFKEGEYNPADMAYELGTSHPKYGKPSSTDNGESGKDQGLTPEETRRAAERRPSSASLNGGGSRRVISYDDLTVEQAARLSDEQFRKLPREVRHRLLGAP